MGRLLHAVSGFAVHIVLIVCYLLLPAEVVTAQMEPGELYPSSILITELVAGEISGEGRLYYLELYNSSEQAVDLAGLTISAGSHSFTITQSLNLDAHNRVRVANRESSRVQPDLIAPLLVLPDQSGEVELLFGDERGVRVTYSELDGIHALELPAGGDDWIVLAHPFESPIPFDGLEPLGGSFGSSGGLAWDPLERTFRHLAQGDSIPPRQAVAVKRGDAEWVRISQPTPRESEQEVPAITFTLESADSRDLATRLQFHEASSHGPDSLDLEKLWPLDTAGERPSNALLYFPGPGSEDPVLSRDSRPLQLEDRVAIPLGHLSHQTGEHTITWELSEIPENWDLLLTDRQRGVVVDMRSESVYRFRTGPTPVQLPDLQEGPVLVPVMVGERAGEERFVITVGPAGFTQHLESLQLESAEPSTIELYQNYPNPFSTTTGIRFYLPVDLDVTVTVFNIVGQRVALLVDEVLQGGERHEVPWDATELPSGLYIVRLETSEGILTRKMTLIR